MRPQRIFIVEVGLTSTKSHRTRYERKTVKCPCYDSGTSIEIKYFFILFSNKVTSKFAAAYNCA